MATEKKTDVKKELTLDDVQAQIREMLAQAKAEAQKIVDEAKAAAGVKEKLSPEEKAARLAYANELVPVRLFKDNGKYKDDQYVGWNGENIVIQRGVKVMIPRKFAEVLEDSDRQDYETSVLIEEKATEFAKTGL